MLHTDELMLVEFAFEKGGVGALHSHPHVQASYVAEGRFEVTIDGRTETSKKGSASSCRPISCMESRRWRPAG